MPWPKKIDYYETGITALPPDVIARREAKKKKWIPHFGGKGSSKHEQQQQQEQNEQHHQPPPNPGARDQQSQGTSFSPNAPGATVPRGQQVAVPVRITPEQAAFLQQNGKLPPLVTLSPSDSLGARSLEGTRAYGSLPQRYLASPNPGATAASSPGAGLYGTRSLPVSEELCMPISSFSAEYMLRGVPPVASGAGYRPGHSGRSACSVSPASQQFIIREEEEEGAGPLSFSSQGSLDMSLSKYKSAEYSLPRPSANHTGMYPQVFSPLAGVPGLSPLGVHNPGLQQQVPARQPGLMGVPAAGVPHGCVALGSVAPGALPSPGVGRSPSLPGAGLQPLHEAELAAMLQNQLEVTIPASGDATCGGEGKRAGDKAGAARESAGATGPCDLCIGRARLRQCVNLSTKEVPLGG